MQDVPNQVEENESNFVKDDFSFRGQGATKESQPKGELIIHPKVLRNLSSISLTPSQIKFKVKA